MESIYYHKVVKGYHFIVMSPENETTHGYYSDKQINWLKEEMAKAQKDDPENRFLYFYINILKIQCTVAKNGERRIVQKLMQY